MPSILCNTMHAMAISACLLELIDRLKAKGSCAETVIQITSEFGRKPRPDASGSEHGSTEQNSTLFLALLPEPKSSVILKVPAG